MLCILAWFQRLRRHSQNIHILVSTTLVQLIVEPAVSALRRLSRLLSVLSWLVQIVVVVLLEVVALRREHRVPNKQGISLVRVGGMLLSLVSWLDMALLLRHLDIAWGLLVRVVAILHWGCSFVHFAYLSAHHSCVIVSVLKLYLILIVYHYRLAHSGPIFSLRIHVTLGSSTPLVVLNIGLRLLVLLVHSVKAVWVKSLTWLLIHWTLEIHSVWSCDLLALSAHGKMIERSRVLLVVDELERVVISRSTKSRCPLVWDIHALSNVLILVTDFSVGSHVELVLRLS